MNNKQLRKVRTKEIIRDNIISSQDDLLKLLRDEGFNLTQATLSRDLKKMKVSKIADASNSYRYILPEESLPRPKSDVRGFLSLEYSGNIAVIRTLAGYASPLAVLMDNNPSGLFIGTIAGRDTIFVTLNEENSDRKEFKNYLDGILFES
jgi:transcriptional regulator of arginine metabolism